MNIRWCGVSAPQNHELKKATGGLRPDGHQSQGYKGWISPWSFIFWVEGLAVVLYCLGRSLYPL